MSPAQSLIPVTPGSTIGILGSGQLGRMLAQAAAQLGLKTHIYAPDRGRGGFGDVRRIGRRRHLRV